MFVGSYYIYVETTPTRRRTTNIMNFDLNVASSSLNSSSSSSLSSATKTTTTRVTRTVHDVDENLAYELRSALHVAIGKICRAEDFLSSSSSSFRPLDNDNAGSPTTPPKKKGFQMNNDAIIALTDLTYHFVTTCFANDLVAFSHHARRKKQVKIDDVLLVARKDEYGCLAELQRVIADNPITYGTTTTSSKQKNGGVVTMTKKKGTATAAVKERSRGSTLANNKRQSKLLSTSALNKGRKKGVGGHDSLLSSSSSSSSSSGESDDDDDDDDDSIGHNHGLKMRRRKLELERKSLTNAATQQKRRRIIGLADDMNDVGDDDDSIHNFIAKDDEDDDDDDEEIDFSAICSGDMARKKNDDESDGGDNEATDYDYLDRAGVGGIKKKKLDQLSSSNNGIHHPDDCSMVIDLCDKD